MKDKANHPRRPTAISLFSGAGGMSQGFVDAGFEILFATDNDAHCLLTYKANHPHTLVYNADARSIAGEVILKRCGLKPGEVDLVFGGPPCRGFSTGNRHNGGADNPHNGLIYDFARLVLEMQPRWFVMENVMGLWHMDKGKVRDKLIQTLAKAYKVFPGILNAADHGVPQLRRRMFLVGTKDRSIDFEFPSSTFGPQPTIDDPGRLPYVTVEEAIGDLPSLRTTLGRDEMKYRKNARSDYQRRMRQRSRSVLNHVITQSNSQVIKRYKRIKPGQNWSSLPDAMIAEWRKLPITTVKKVSHHNLYLRLDPKKPSPTIGNFRKSMLIHMIEDRGLSIREAARLQSFPDRYAFKEGINSMQQQIGNATPPLLAEAIGRQVLGYMRTRRSSK